MLIFVTRFIISISSKKRGSYNRHHRLSVVYTKEEQRFPELFGSMVKSLEEFILVGNSLTGYKRSVFNTYSLGLACAVFSINI